MSDINKIKEAIVFCTENRECTGCPYEDRYSALCIDELLRESKEKLEAAERRLNTIEKMLTEWEMVDLRDALLREIKLWHKQRGDSDE